MWRDLARLKVLEVWVEYNQHPALGWMGFEPVHILDYHLELRFYCSYPCTF